MRRRERDWRRCSEGVSSRRAYTIAAVTDLGLLRLGLQLAVETKSCNDSMQA